MGQRVSEVINDEPINGLCSYRHLGVYMDNTFGWKARVESVCYHLEQTLTVNQMVYVIQGCITEHFNMSAISKNISFKAYLSGEHREYGLINLYSPCQVALSSDRRNGYPNVN